MRRLILLPFALACSSAPPAPPAAPPPPSAVAVAAPPEPRCKRSDPNEPADVRAKMGALRDDVRRCFLLGSGADEASRIGVDVTIGEDGKVRAAKVDGVASSRASAISCTESAVKGAAFATFCGDAVSVRWTYALE